MDLLIVHDEFTADIAQQMNAIISTIPDCQARIFSEKEWNDNKAQISSDQHVLFLGNVADGLALRERIQWKFQKLNMQYGWIGKRALVLVDEHTFNKEEITELKNLFEQKKIQYATSGVKVGIMVGAFTILGLIGVGIGAITMAIINKKSASKIYKAEYSYLLDTLLGNQQITFNKFMGIEA